MVSSTASRRRVPLHGWPLSLYGQLWWCAQCSLLLATAVVVWTRSIPHIHRTWIATSNQLQDCESDGNSLSLSLSLSVCVWGGGGACVPVSVQGGWSVLEAARISRTKSPGWTVSLLLRRAAKMKMRLNAVGCA